MDVHVFSVNENISNEFITSLKSYIPETRIKKIDNLTKHDMNGILLLVFSMNNDSSYTGLETLLKTESFVSKFNKTFLIAYRPMNLSNSISTRNIILHNILCIPIVFVYKDFIPNKLVHLLSDKS